MSDETLLAFDPGQFVPKPWSQDDRQAPPEGLERRDMQELAALNLNGVGIEFGALSSPYPVPLHCDVTYADVFRYEEILRLYAKKRPHELVRPLIQADLAHLGSIADDSVDFIVASHVIEHTTDPIGSILRAGKKVRQGGSIVLVVPDMERTFDRNRSLTSLEHLILDYEGPSRERDREHYVEFYQHAYHPGMPHAADWEASFNQSEPIHFHTWTYASFLDMAAWIHRRDPSLSLEWSHPTLKDKENFEFYAVFRRT